MKQWLSLWLESPPKPARMGRASGYIMRKGSSDFFSSVMTTRYLLYETRSLRHWASHRSRSRPHFARPTRRFSAANEFISWKQLSTGSHARTCTSYSAARSFIQTRTRPLKPFQKMLGLKASASLVLQLGLLHMRPLQYWLKPRVPPHAWHHGWFRVKVNQVCVAALSPWKNHQWMEWGVPMGMVYRRKVVSTDISNSNRLGGAVRRKTGFWPLVEKGRSPSHQLPGKVAICLGLRTFLLDLRRHHVLVRSDRMTVVSYIKRLGGLSSRLLFFSSRTPLEVDSAQLALAESNACAGQTEPGSRHAILEQCPLRRVDAPLTNGSANIWGIFGRPEVDLFASEYKTHCQTYFSKDRNTLAHDWPNLLLYAFPPIALIPQVIRRIWAQKQKSYQKIPKSSVSGPALEEPALACGAVLAARYSPMAYSSETRPPLSGEWNVSAWVLSA